MSAAGEDVSFDGSTGVLTLSGNATAAAYQAVLRTVTYANAAGYSASTAARGVTFTIGSGLRYAGTGHFYEFVASAGVTWDAANTAASGRTYFGLQGYLVTVTSSGENTFVKGKLAQNAWMGLSTGSLTNPRTWSWVTGPEAGITRVKLFRIARPAPQDGQGCLWHPSLPGQQTIALGVRDVVAEALGWR